MKIFYCDGSTRGGKNQKGADNIGGWGVVCFTDETEMEITAYFYDSETNTTNNRQELKGLLCCLRHADEYYPNEPCIIYSDSAYVVSMCNTWIHNWSQNGWRNSKKQLVENYDLVKELWDQHLSKGFYHCEIRKCDGHVGNIGNELADALATNNLSRFKALYTEAEIELIDLDNNK